jgi:hypothetical protein
MPKTLMQWTKVHDLSHLSPGDVLQVRRKGTLVDYQGEVETVVPQQGILWIRHGALHERKLITASEYDLFTASCS